MPLSATTLDVHGPFYCLNCQAPGHDSSDCKQDTVCRHCTGTHTHNECKIKESSVPKCIHRKGAHKAHTGECKAPEVLAARAATAEAVKKAADKHPWGKDGDRVADIIHQIYEEEDKKADRGSSPVQDESDSAQESDPESLSSDEKTASDEEDGSSDEFETDLEPSDDEWASVSESESSRTQSPEPSSATDDDAQDSATATKSNTKVRATKKYNTRRRGWSSAQVQKAQDCLRDRQTFQNRL
jgi:hypothetical protein